MASTMSTPRLAWFSNIFGHLLSLTKTTSASSFGWLSRWCSFSLSLQQTCSCKCGGDMYIINLSIYLST